MRSLSLLILSLVFLFGNYSSLFVRLSLFSKEDRLYDLLIFHTSAIVTIFVFV